MQNLAAVLSYTEVTQTFVLDHMGNDLLFSPETTTIIKTRAKQKNQGTEKTMAQRNENILFTNERHSHRKSRDHNNKHETVPMS